MNEKDKLIYEYIDKGVRYGGELIVSKQFCDEFISSCELVNLAIIGIEGFLFYEDETVEPVLDEIADFSDISSDNWQEYLEKSLSAARKFLGAMQNIGRSDGYSFTLVNPKERKAE